MSGGISGIPLPWWPRRSSHRDPFTHTFLVACMKCLSRQASQTSSPAIHHGVGRAQQNIVVRRVYHRHMMLLQVRGIQNRQRKLAMHIIHMDDVGLELLQQCLELTLRLERVDQRGGFLHLLECGDLPHIILFGNEKLAPTTWFVIGMLHGEERHLMAKLLQAFSQGKEICFGAAPCGRSTC